MESCSSSSGSTQTGGKATTTDGTLRNSIEELTSKNEKLKHEVNSFRTSVSLGPEDREPASWGDDSKSADDSEVEEINDAAAPRNLVSSLAAARAALATLEVADREATRDSLDSETADLDEIAPATRVRGTPSPDSARLSIAPQDDFNF